MSEKCTKKCFRHLEVSEDEDYWLETLTLHAVLQKHHWQGTIMIKGTSVKCKPDTEANNCIISGLQEVTGKEAQPCTAVLKAFLVHNTQASKTIMLVLRKNKTSCDGLNIRT